MIEAPLLPPNKRPY